MRELDWSEIINILLLATLIILIFTAIQQGYFEDRKCNKYCEENFELAMVEGPNGIMECKLNWNEILNRNEELNK